MKNAYAVDGDSTRLKLDVCLKSFKVDKPIALKNILYDFNKATLRPESKIALDALVSILRDNPKIKVELSSHTDSVGSAFLRAVFTQKDTASGNRLRQIP